MKKKLCIMINKEECLGEWCAICVGICPEEAIIIDDVAHIDEEKCIECGKCVKNVCPNYAIISKEEN